MTSSRKIVSICSYQVSFLYHMTTVSTIVFVICVNTGMVMSKGKMPAVKEKAYISHSQNHHEKSLLVRC